MEKIIVVQENGLMQFVTGEKTMADMEEAYSALAIQR